ncbi:MAG TPA: YfjI family protein [Terracidiphilus sp.]
MQVPIDFPAVVSVATLAGICGRRATIQPKALDDSWEVVPNLWGAVVADAGMMKSPVIKAVTAPALAIEKEWRSEFESELKNFERESKLWTLDEAVWSAQYKRAQKAPQQDSGKPIGAPELRPEPKSPTRRRLLTTDATLESLHKLLGENRAGIFVLRDELTGWLTSLDKQGRESERSFYLECWNGDSSFTIDRIGRGSIYVESCCVSLFGGIQPSRLRQYFANAMQEGEDSDGLIQRFQLLIWPEKLPSWSYEDRRRDASAFKLAESAYRAIANINVDSPRQMKFDDEAQAHFVGWLTRFMNSQVLQGDLHPSLESHFSKYRSLMPSLALLFSLADGLHEHVGLEQAIRAERWCEYLMGHARRVYAARTDPGYSAALALKSKIERGMVGDSEGRFTVRDIYRNEWRELSSPEQVRKAIAVLEDHNWVREYEDDNPLEDALGLRRPGRPTEVYLVNPRILDRARQETGHPRLSTENSTSGLPVA